MAFSSEKVGGLNMNRANRWNRKVRNQMVLSWGVLTNLGFAKGVGLVGGSFAGTRGQFCSNL